MVGRKSSEMTESRGLCSPMMGSEVKLRTLGGGALCG